MLLFRKYGAKNVWVARDDPKGRLERCARFCYLLTMDQDFENSTRACSFQASQGIYSGVTTTTSPPSMFTPATKSQGDEWKDHDLPLGPSETFIRVDGPNFKSYDGMWFGLDSDAPKTREEAVQKFDLPSTNPATHLYRFRFNISQQLEAPVIALRSRVLKTGVTQFVNQKQTLLFVEIIDVIELT